MASTYATDIYPGTGSETEFDLTFEFISRDHVGVAVINNSDGAETILTVIETGEPVGNEYRWENDTRIKVGTAPTADQKIRIRRDTPENQQLVPWADGSYLLSEDLNTSDLQWLYGLQELEDKFGLLQTTAIKYLGAIDLTVDEAPVNPTGGDFFINTGAGTVIASWTGIAGDTVVGAEQVIYSAADLEWQIFAVPSSQQGVVQVTGTSPIAVDNTDTQRPDVSITPATASAAGSMSAADKAKLDGLPADAEANVNADWNAASGDAEILNKPSIPAAQVNSDWDATSGVAEILNKPDVIDGDAPSDGKTYGRKDSAWSEVEPGGVTQIVAGNNVTISPSSGTGVVTVNSTGGGGGGGDNYSGASAWALTDNSGNVLNSLNIASVTRTGAGKYDYVFTTPMPSADYSIAGNVTDTTGGSTNGYISFSNLTTNGFLVTTKDGSNNTVNRPHSVAVFAINALSPKGTTGTDSFGSVERTTANGPCVVSGSFNVESVTRISEGYYQVTFTTPMPTPNYGVTTSLEVVTPSEDAFVYSVATVSEKASTGFRVLTRFQNYDNGGTRKLDIGFNFTVNATNAQLPETVTQEQIESAINNPGLSAWGFVNNGVLLNGLNINSTISNPLTGVYDITFVTPMPDSNYSVVATSGLEVVTTASNCSVGSKTPNGFQININTINSGAPLSQSFQFQVAATNALPPKGGTGADAWCTSTGEGFNVASVVQSGGNNNNFTVTFTSPMPSDTYAVVATVATSSEGTCFVRNRTATSFQVVTRALDGTSAALGWSAVIHATNATLPSVFTEAEIQAVVDLAQSIDQAQLAKAWASVNSGGTLAAIHNIASVTNTATGVYEVVFATPMPSAFYSVSTAVTSNTYAVARPTAKTANGFTMRTLFSSSGTPTPGAYSFDFQVFAN